MELTERLTEREQLLLDQLDAVLNYTEATCRIERSACALEPILRRVDGDPVVFYLAPRLHDAWLAREDTRRREAYRL